MLMCGLKEREEIVRRFIPIAAAFGLLFWVCSGTQEDSLQGHSLAQATPEGWSVLMVVAEEGFRDEEYHVPRSVLEENGVRVTVASSDTMPAKGMLGLEVKPDLALKDVKVEDYDCLIFVGGVGAEEYWDDEVAHSLAISAADSGKVLGAICIAPVTLARAGVLRGKKGTVFKTRRTIEAFKREGVIYTGDEVTVSGRIVTGRDPEAAEKFARSIVSLLSGPPAVEGEK